MATSTMSLFAGELARDSGIHQAAMHREDLLGKVREYVELLAKSRADRLATADDYEPFLKSIGKTNADLGNAAGAVFKYDAFECTQIWQTSRRKSNHARPIRVWRLK